MKFIAVAVLLFLAACRKDGGNPPSASAPVTIPDLALYLVQGRCPGDGLPTACATPVAQQAADRVTWRRSDGQDQVSDSVAAAHNFVPTWSYAPFGAFDASHGDGGEIYVS